MNALDLPSDSLSVRPEWSLTKHVDFLSLCFLICKWGQIITSILFAPQDSGKNQILSKCFVNNSVIKTLDVLIPEQYD